jgi:ribonuclease E
MGVILRTAGASRTKAEVKRDFEYLMRLWENVRTLTLESSAPCLVYEEGSLIKRTIRDLYNKDITEVLVSGDGGYREAKDFMRMIMPSHSKNVQAYKDDAPIFSRYNIESQLDSMFHPQVTLPSGGYIVINPTEALVSIDVNSGRATKEHNIEDTALQTNLEAAEEISRQLRLRDLAGLIVIDFIDMEERRNNRAVEKKLKDCLKNDRARIQVGHISHFGLMEMSRQRIRFGVLESSTHSCPTCAGTGLVRSVSSLALMIMRAIEDHVLRKPGQSINVNMPSEVALYILNTKRDTLTTLEAKYGLSITISAQSGLVGSQFNIERGEARTPVAAAPVQHIRADAASLDDYEEPEVEEEVAEEPESESEAASADGQNGRGRRRRRRRRGGSNGAIQATEVATPDAESGDTEDEPHGEASFADDDDQPRKRRRRGRRGGRRNKRPNEGFGSDEANEESGDAAAVSEASDAEAMGAVEETAPAAAEDIPAAPEPVAAEEAPAEKPKRPRRTRKPKAAEAEAETVAQEAVESAEQAPAAEAAPEKPARKPRAPRRKKVETEATTETPAPEPVEAAPVEDAPAPDSAQPEDGAETRSRRKKVVPADEIVVSSTGEETDEKPKKVGWWQRRLGLG